MVIKIKIVATLFQEPIQRYRRAPIDYSVLDEVGHGSRTVQQGSRSNLVRIFFCLIVNKKKFVLFV